MSVWAIIGISLAAFWCFAIYAMCHLSGTISRAEERADDHWQKAKADGVVVRFTPRNNTTSDQVEVYAAIEGSLPILAPREAKQ